MSPQARAVLGLAAARPTPQEVMKAILEAPVDLLWFGGIGTYVRASDESNEAVGDRANDAIRAVGSALRCKVIGEGANLGMTQLGRIEAALHGVRLNTDAIDNSAGVNTSDVEVNLKIALSLPLHDGRLTWPDRNALLASMTDEVAALVLRNNYQQTLAISLDQQRGLEDLGFQQRLMQTLEKRHELDRAVEFLPDDSEIAERRRRGIPLTRPEIAVLLAYAKLSLHGDLLASRVPDDPYLARELGRYFPPSVTTRFPDAVERHRLRRDIISTGLANSMINRGGPTLVVRIADQTGASVDRIAAAFAAVRDSYSLTALNTAIEELDGKIDGGAQLSLFVAVQNLLLDRIVWFLRNVDLGRGLADIVAHYQSGIAAVVDGLERPVAARGDRSARGEGGEARRPGYSGGTGAADRRPSGADRCNRRRPHFRPHRQVGHRGRADLLRGDSGISSSTASSAVSAPSKCPTISIASRSTARSTPSAMRCAASRPRCPRHGSGAAAVDRLDRPSKDGAERVREAIHEIAASGLTLSKLSVAASMLGDIARTT